MTQEIKPWAAKPFELICHAEVHFQRGLDSDKRLSLISFDNSIEVSVAAYLALKPKHRGGRKHDDIDVKKVLDKYPTRLQFFFDENSRRGLPIYVEQDDILWYHDNRNDHYHSAGYGVPATDTLNGIRKAAIWIFSVLFETPDAEKLLLELVDAAKSFEPIIKSEYVKLDFTDISAVASDTTKAAVLASASLAGGWDEKNEFDMAVIKRLADGF